MFIGEAAVSEESDVVTLLETNLDDVPGEFIGYTLERLFGVGALDAWTTPITMKKQRPAVMLSVLCPPTAVQACEDLLFAETGTLGIRRQSIQRTKQHRREHSVNTAWGAVRGNWHGAVGNSPDLLRSSMTAPPSPVSRDFRSMPFTGRRLRPTPVLPSCPGNSMRPS